MPTTPVTLLTGFLGSGKTTLLAKLLGAPELANAAVIINEFGEVSIDHLIVAHVAEWVVELRSGCLCCTIRGDLALTLADLYRQRQLGDIPAFTRVLVETSGLADPIPLVHTLMANPPLAKAFHLEAVVSVVDTVNAPATLPAHESATNQIALADVLVLSKIDLANAAEIAATEALLDEINPAAERIRAVAGTVAPAAIVGRARFSPAARAADLERWLALHAGHDHSHDPDHGLGYGSHLILREGSLSLAGTSVFLNRVVNEERGRVLRIKGIAGFRERSGQPAVVHAVQNKFYPLEWLPAWPDLDHRSRLVFIGRGLDIARIDERFAALCI